MKTLAISQLLAHIYGAGYAIVGTGNAPHEVALLDSFIEQSNTFTHQTQINVYDQQKGEKPVGYIEEDVYQVYCDLEQSPNWFEQGNIGYACLELIHLPAGNALSENAYYSLWFSPDQGPDVTIFLIEIPGAAAAVEQAYKFESEKLVVEQAIIEAGGGQPK